jgi:PAS domain S-box-containing protein
MEMSPRHLVLSDPSAISRYAISVLSVAIAIVIAEGLTRLLHTEPIASSMLCAVIFAAWVGFGPGLLAIALSLFAFHYYLVPPTNSFGLKHDILAVDYAELPRLALFSITSLFVNFISLAQRNAREAALKAEAKAAGAERELRLVTDTIPALVWSALPDGAVEYFNQRWLTYTGLTVEQARGWGFLDAYHPDERALIRNLTSPARSFADSGNDLTTEVRLRSVDGKYRWFLLRAMALRDPVGNIVRWYGTAIDIEDRKRAEDALRRSEAYLAEAQRLSATGSFGWRVASGDMVWSEETYQIVELDRSVRPTIDLLLQRVHPEDRELVRQEVNRVAESNHDLDIELRLLMPNGRVKDLHVRSHRVEGESGDEEVVGAVMDVTATKDAQQELHAAQAELAHVNRVTTMGQLAASIAHEIKQPITAVVTNASAGLLWLDAQPPELGEVRDAFDRVINAGNRAGQVIGQIRALIKNDPPRKDDLDLNEAILEVIALTRGEMVKKGVSLRTQFASGLPHVQGDRVQLQQVILNLIINAVEAMSDVTERPRELLISSRKDASSRVIVAVQDSGPGLTHEGFDRLFNPFYTTKPDGMGMGLSICRSIVEAHGGRVWASRADASGISIQFSLPVGGESQNEASTGSPEAGALGPGAA